MTGNWHTRLPVVVNATGSVTRLGGAPMPPEVLEAFQSAAGQPMLIEQLQAVASRRIADLTGTDAGLVTAGSAAALTLGTAAILTGHDLGRMERLPHCEGFPHEFLIAREQRSGYDHSVRAAGARLVEVGFNEIVANAGVRRTECWEYEAAITEETAGIVYVLAPDSRPPLAELVEVAHRHGLPVIVDAAGELPPRSNLKDIPATGADLVCFSGGKAIRGPQSTGILCGRRDLVSSAALQMLDMDDHPELWDPPPELIDCEALGGVPRHGIGRGLKVSKEEIAALLTALDLFASGAYVDDNARFRGYLVDVVTRLGNAACDCDIVAPRSEDGWPVLELAVHEQQLGRSALEVCRRLREGAPAVYVGHGKLSAGRLVISPLCLDDTSVEQLAEALAHELCL